MRGKTSIGRMIVGACVVAGCLTVLTIGWRMWSAREYADGIGEALTFAVLGWDEQTRFGRGYSERRFLSIAPKMTEGEVVKRLGNPVDASKYPKTNERVLHYSTGDRNGTFWWRAVGIDSTGRVVRVYRMLHCD